MVASPRAARLTLNERLASALPWHYKQDHDYRESHRELVRDYAGRTTYPDWLGQYDDPDGGSKRKQIVNLTMQACQAHVLGMAANRPRFLASAHAARLTPFANRIRRNLDRYAKRLYLEEVLKDFARNSWFSTGICKVYQSASAAVAADADHRMQAGQPFAQSLTILRAVRDTDAESPDKASFIGDIYSIDYWEAIKSPRFTKKARAAIKELGPNGWYQDAEDERDHPNSERVEDALYLADVFVRRGKSGGPEVRTYAVDRQFNFLIPRALQVIPWKGESCGPYYFLNMGPVPGYFWSSSPGINQRLLQEFTNTLYRKLEDQSRRMKSILTAENDEDALAAGSAFDGEVKRFLAPDKIVEIRLSGPDAQLFGMLQNAFGQYSRANGNLDAKLGLGPSADTASQERMIGVQVSRMEAFYQGEFVSSVRNIAKGLARLMWEDNELHIPGSYTIPGTDISVDDDWLPAKLPNSREGEFDLYEVDIDPYSLPYKSPSERAAFLDAQVSKWMPFAPFLAEQGIRMDPVAYFEAMADLGNAPELRSVFKANQPPMEADGPMHNRTLAAGGAREYVHRSAGSAGNSGQPDPMQYFTQQQPVQGPSDG